MSFKLDFQKREAKQSLWDMDGQHIKKKYRNKGKGRQKDKKLIRAELDLAVLDSHDAWDEIDEAWNCERTLAEERKIILDNEAWAEFVSLLDSQSVASSNLKSAMKKWKRF